MSIDTIYAPADLEDIKRQIRSTHDLNHFIATLVASRQAQQAGEIPDSTCPKCGGPGFYAPHIEAYICPTCDQDTARRPPAERRKKKFDEARTLEKLMTVAIGEERYEDAAVYRDQLKKIKDRAGPAPAEVATVGQERSIMTGEDRTGKGGLTNP